MVEIPVPQTLGFNEFATGIDSEGNLIGQKVGFEQLSFVGQFGAFISSTTQVTPAYGDVVLTLDDETNFAENQYVQVQSQTDITNFFYGVITKLDFSISPVQITVAVTDISINTATDNNWWVQVVGIPTVGVAANAILGISTTEVSSGDVDVGDTVSITIQQDRLFPSSSDVLVYSKVDPNQYFRGIVNTYDSSTGELSLFVLSTSVVDTAEVWIANIIGTSVVSADQIATSSDTVSLEAGDIVFTIQEGKFFPVGGKALAVATESPNNKVIGTIKSYISGTLTIRANNASIYGSGEFDAWTLQLLDGPPLQGGNPPTSVSFFGSSTSVDSATITLPANIEEGDIIVFEDATEQFGPLVITPSGFTSIDKLPTGAPEGTQSWLSYKVADGTEGGAVITGITPLGESRKTALVFRPNSSAPVTVNSIVSVISNSAIGTQTITSDSGTEPLFVVVVFGILTGSSLGAQTISASDGNVANGGGTNINTNTYYKIYNSSDADVTASLADGGNRNFIQGLYFQFVSQPYEPGDVVVFGNDGSGNPQYPAADGSLIGNLPGIMPSAIGCISITPTAVAGNISSVDTGTEIITWSTNHGLTTGELITSTGGTWPTGVTANAAYYVNALTATTFALYTTYADAIANTNKVNLTAAGSGTRTMRRLVLATKINEGLDATTPFQFTAATTTITAIAKLNFTLANANLIQATTILGGPSIQSMPTVPASSTTTTVTASPAADNVGATFSWTNLASASVYQLQFQLYG